MHDGSRRWQEPSIAALAGVFRKHPAGVAVISADAGDGPAALTATSVASVSMDPPLLVFSVSDLSSSAPTLVGASTVVVHLLNTSDAHLGRLCATSGIDRFGDTSLWNRLPTGEPYFYSTGTRIRCRTRERVKAGTATLLVVEALEVQPAASEDPALIYCDRDWQWLPLASV